MNIGFTGHRDKVTHIHELASLLARYPGALWIHGGAAGFDTQVNDFAKLYGLTPKVIRPEYNKYPVKVAPIMRNYVIVDMADLLVACWDGRTYGGTWRTIEYAKSKGKQIVYVTPTPGEGSRTK